MDDSAELTLETISDWNIISPETTKIIAAFAPTTEEELESLGVLGESKLKEYGTRLVKVIKKFVEDNNLEKYIQSRPTKRLKVAEADTKMSSVVISSSKTTNRSAPKSNAIKPVIEIEDNDDEYDEFATDINFDLIDIP